MPPPSAYENPPCPCAPAQACRCATAWACSRTALQPQLLLPVQGASTAGKPGNGPAIQGRDFVRDFTPHAARGPRAPAAVGALRAAAARTGPARGRWASLGVRGGF